MQIDFNIPVIILGIIISQGIFAGLILVFNKENKFSSRILAAFLFISSLWLLDSFFNIAGVYRQNPDFYFLPIYYSFGFGPLIFFYVMGMTNHKFRLHLKNWIHFFPMIIQGVYYAFLTTQDYSYRRDFWFDIHRPYLMEWEFNITFLSLVIYIFVSIKYLINYQKWVNNNYSEISRIKLQWLKVILLFMFVICAQWLILAILRKFFDIYDGYDYLTIVLGLFTLILAFGGIKQGALSEVAFVPDKTEEGSLPTPELDQKMIDTIVQEMEKNKYYLDPNLTLNTFALKLDLPARSVSVHINHGLQKTFIDFVNYYRVEEVKRKIRTGINKKFTLFTVALESGFNSKSTFNRIFKKFTGKAPSEFIDE